MREPHSALLEVGRRSADRNSVSGDATTDLIAWVRSGSGESLARIQFISDDGVRLILNYQVLLGDIVHIVLCDAEVIEGRVAWTNGRSCGIMFRQPIDSVSTLCRIVERSKNHACRPSRLPLDRMETNAMSVSNEGLLPVRVLDVSQAGMKLTHDGRFSPGLHVRVATENGVERGGIVRWSHNGIAGLLLDDPFVVEGFGAIRMWHQRS